MHEVVSSPRLYKKASDFLHLCIAVT